MSRRRKSLAEDLTEVVAMLPWWLCLAAALGSYLLFSWVASLASASKGPMFGAVVGGLGTAAKVIAPIICVAAALISALKAARARKLVRSAREAAPQAAIDGMNWAEFERLIGEMFRERGYRVVETGGGGADGGVDLVLSKGGETFLVQCKQWRALKVGVSVVRELYGVMAARGAAGGFVVTSGVFTDDARAFADGRNVTLMDGAAIAKHLAAGPMPAAAERPADRPTHAAPVAPPLRPSAPARAAEAVEPTCPNCSAQMVRRKAQRGTNAGQHFWGCSRFPQCKGTRSIA